MKTVIMNFSGVYPEEDFYRQKAGDYEMVDFTHAEGVNCYCTDVYKRQGCWQPVRHLSGTYGCGLRKDTL